MSEMLVDDDFGVYWLTQMSNFRRITYECHLTLVKARDSIHGSVRKLLTVDIGFDQITMLRFGCNKVKGTLC